MLKRLLIIAAIVASCAVQAQQQQAKVTHYVVLDGGKYKGEELKWAASHPTPSTMPYMDKNNWYIITRSADNHYYVPGAINGHPVTFMIDTGASSTAIGLGVARNAGIKAGESGQAQTANGVGQTAKSTGNSLQIGPFLFSDMTVGVVLNTGSKDMVLLGMDALKRFRIFQGQDAMQIQRIN